MSISEFRAFNFPCEVPEISWWKNTKIPKFRTVKSLGFKVISVGDIHYTNSSGQVNNSARSIGTDNVNFAAIKNSFENQGINPNFLPPVVLQYEEKLELLDGFTRHSVLVDKSQEKFVYLVVSNYH